MIKDKYNEFRKKTMNETITPHRIYEEGYEQAKKDFYDRFREADEIINDLHVIGEKINEMFNRIKNSVDWKINGGEQ